MTFLSTFFRGLSSLRSGAKAREREAIDDVGRARDEEARGRRENARDRDFWQRTSAGYAGQLLRAGIEPIPANPIPPSEREAR